MNTIPILVRTLALMGLGFVSALSAQVSFTADYEPIAAGGTGDAGPGSGVGSLTVNQLQYFDGRAFITTTPVAVPGRPGNNVLFFETRQQDGNYRSTSGNRTEIRWLSQNYNNNNNNATTEVWYAWSIFLPNNALYDGDEDLGGDADGGGREIYFQVHGPDGDTYTTSKRPPFAIQRQVVGGSVRWLALWRNQSTPDGGSGPAESPFDLGPCTTGVWTDFVVRIVWGNDGTANGTAGPGSIRLLRDGVETMNVTGIDVGYRDHPFMYAKAGIYAYDWNVLNQTGNNSPGGGSNDPYIASSYWDEVKIVAGPSSYDAMKPRRTGGTTPPPATVDGDGNLSGTKLTVAGASVTASANDGNVPGNTVDGNLSTRWSANGPIHWIRYDLGTARTVTHLRLAWHQGDVRVSDFDVEASNDGASWTRIRGTANSAGNTTAFETVDVQNTSARYIRVVGYGNNVNDWNSLSEVEIYALGAPLPQIVTNMSSVGPNLMGEGGQTGGFTVQLSSAPATPVTVSLQLTGPALLAISGPSSFTFDSSNWNVPRGFPIDSFPDSNTTNELATLTFSAPGLASITRPTGQFDNFAFTIITSATTATVPEGGTTSFQVRLSHNPSPYTSVTVTAARASGDSDITVSGGSSLVFTIANSSLNQTVILAAAQDADTTAGSAVIALTSPALNTVNVTATEADNDTAVPVTTTFTATDDAFLEGSTRINDTHLKVNTSNPRLIYLKFSPSGLTGTVTDVKLRLTVDTALSDSPGSGTIRVYRGNGSTGWTESTLSTTLRPTYTAPADQVGVLTNSNIAAGTTYDIPLTGAVTGNGTYSFVIAMDASGNGVGFNSDEDTGVAAALRPALVVTTQ